MSDTDTQKNPFEPYLDWEKVTPEMADDLRKAISGHRTAMEQLLRAATPEHAAEVMKAHDHLDYIWGAIRSAIATIPMIVHIAGPKQSEECPEPLEDEPEHEHVVQRCARCGSMLHMWREGIITMTDRGPRELEEDDIPWWDEGAVVAKTTTAVTQGVGMYRIEDDRSLEKHEHECVGLPNMEGA